MSNLYTLVIFDLDGTIIDSKAGILHALAKTIEENGLPRRSRSQLLTFVGPQIAKAFEDQFGLSRARANELTSKFRENYTQDTFLFDAKVYHGVLSLLEALKQREIHIGIATFKQHDCMVRLLEHLGIAQYFEGNFFGSDWAHRLTKADVVRKSLEYAKEMAENCVMIGDSLSDGMAACELGMDFIGVEYGFGLHSKEESFQCPNAVGSASSPEEILEIIIKKRGAEK